MQIQHLGDLDGPVLTLDAGKQLGHGWSNDEPWVKEGGCLLILWGASLICSVKIDQSLA